MDNLRTLVVDASQTRLEVADAIAWVSDPRFGGIATFIGCVRGANLGRVVTGISYDIFRPLALHIFADIGAQARREVGDPLKLYIAHACGRLAVGDIAVLVAAGTPHRDEAFRACRLAIEAVKHAAPIWKQEHYIDGDSAWSEGCSLCDAQSAEAGVAVAAGSHQHPHGHRH